jgi:ectoine hydroxylase-related dioxygenase (phytanoyl-CoA dioxygenase family)
VNITRFLAHYELYRMVSNLPGSIVELGQGIVFHSNLIHKSGANYSEFSRFAIQSRWFDAKAADAIENLYSGGVDEGKNPNIYLSA